MFIWQDGVMTDIGTPTGESLTRGMDINDRGQVLGWRAEPPGDYLGFIWQDGAVTEFGPIPGGDDSWPNAINGLGQAAGRGDFDRRDGDSGRHAYQWTGEAVVDLGVLDGYTKSIACGINNEGNIVGQAFASDIGLQKVATLCLRRPPSLNAKEAGAQGRRLLR